MQPLVMSGVVHSSSPVRRPAAPTRALGHIEAPGEKVWFATPGEIARAVEAHPGRAAQDSVHDLDGNA